MKRSSRYFPLQWVVEVHGHCGAPFWEQIAAFNSEAVALGYARDCQLAANRRGAVATVYRVIVRRARDVWVTV